MNVTATFSCATASAVVVISIYWTLMIGATNIKTAFTTRSLRTELLYEEKYWCRSEVVQTPWPRAVYPSLFPSISLLYAHTSPSVTVVAFSEPEQAVSGQSQRSGCSLYIHWKVFYVAYCTNRIFWWVTTSYDKSMCQLCASDHFNSFTSKSFCIYVRGWYDLALRALSSAQQAFWPHTSALFSHERPGRAQEITPILSE